MTEKKAKILMTIMASFAVLVIVGILAVDLIGTGRDDSSNNKEMSKEDIEKVNNKANKKKGKLKKKNSDKSFVIRDYKTDVEFVFSSEGDIDIRNEYSKSIEADKLSIGDIVEVGYEKEYEALKYIYLQEDVIRYEGLENFTLGKDNKYIKVDNIKYRLSEDTYIYNNGERITVYDLNERDIITVNIIDKEVISINIIKGHGFINLTNYNKYIGNTLIINDEDACDIENEMKKAVSEGENVVVIKTDRLKGSQIVTVKRGQTVNIDVSKIKFEEKKEGYVTFEIEPSSARLYINGKSYYNRENILLDYGNYNYNVELAGYDSIMGRFVIDELTQKVKIQLQEKATATPSPSPSPTATDLLSESDKKEETSESKKTEE